MARSVPTCAIQNEYKLFGWPSADLAGELRQFYLEQGDVDRRSEMKDGASRGGMDEADYITPGVTVLDWGKRSLAIEAPDFVQDGFQANAVLIHRPELYLRLRVGGCDRTEERAEVFLNASCCSGSAWTWRGRGLRRLPSSRTR